MDATFLERRIEAHNVVIVNARKQNVVVNLNKYIAKYDPQIAKLICDTDVPYKTDLFREKQLAEVLEVCNQAFNGTYLSLWDLDGT
jgi:hypothetical protein